MKIHLISGFLGSGKTTAIRQAVDLLTEQGIRAGVITNDQGSKLVDGAFFENLAVPSREVINGCFCCNYQDLEAGIKSLIDADNVEIIFAESVGSCTDIIATVLKPLLQFRPQIKTTLSVFADARLFHMMLDEGGPFDEAVRYIYRKQLEEAGIIVVSKVDLVSSDQLLLVKHDLQQTYPGTTLIYQNSLERQDVKRWMDILNADTAASKLPSLEIDYDIYAGGEAKMAWLDESIEIFSASRNARQLASELINTIYQKVKANQLAVGHLKFLVDDILKISFTSVTGDPVVLPKTASARVALLINMRVETSPPVLEQIVEEAIEETRLGMEGNIIVNSQAAFKPGYPRPLYRL